LAIFRVVLVLVLVREILSETGDQDETRRLVFHSGGTSAKRPGVSTLRSSTATEDGRWHSTALACRLPRPERQGLAHSKTWRRVAIPAGGQGGPRFGHTSWTAVRTECPLPAPLPPFASVLFTRAKAPSPLRSADVLHDTSWTAVASAARHRFSLRGEREGKNKKRQRAKSKRVKAQRITKATY
jgi:hypothetical protein